MKKILICLTCLSIISCSRQSSEDTEAKKAEIINTDKAFSAMSAQKGMREAFIAFAADDVIKPQDGRHPVVGKMSLLESFKDAPQQEFILTWEPLKVDVSGDLGYTFGNWIRKSKSPTVTDTTYYGNYISIWKRQPDGTWKYVFDSGNSTPAPTLLDLQ
jgi:ketosteroid isomerase-like protein